VEENLLYPYRFFKNIFIENWFYRCQSGGEKLIKKCVKNHSKMTVYKLSNWGVKNRQKSTPK
jgi:hypothetical protein